MLGAVIRMSDAVKLESLDIPIKERFGRLAIKNQTAAKRAYDEVRIINEG
jgi:pyruvate ferredoxin oxidoreductase gamma subunit